MRTYNIHHSVNRIPEPTYDLWEQVFLTTTYTTAVTYAALQSAADLAEVAGDESKRR